MRCSYLRNEKWMNIKLNSPHFNVDNRISFSFKFLINYLNNKCDIYKLLQLIKINFY